MAPVLTRAGRFGITFSTSTKSRLQFRLLTAKLSLRNELLYSLSVRSLTVMSHHFIGVDVGTASVRAGLVDKSGTILAVRTEGIKIWNSAPDFYEQSSDDIWNAVVKTVNGVIDESKVSPQSVKGLGFDATCSLVVLDKNFRPLTVSQSGEQEQNIVMWMDHRAAKEAAVINATNHSIAKSVISLEMQPPKLMWLKKNLPYTWKNAAHFFDLPDFLTWRATGSLTRSVCSVSCKWTYQQKGWADDFFSLINLQDLCEDGYSKIGSNVQDVGSPCGTGLSVEAAKQLNLAPGTVVGTAMIDAYAGVIACLGCSPTHRQLTYNMENCLVMIAGTSTCHIVSSNNAVHVPGVWGPYLSALVPGLWNNEGGQSAAGSLIDFVTQNHPAYPAVKEKAQKKGIHVLEYLSGCLEEMARVQHCSSPSELTCGFHVWPDFHGNRSPLADSSLKGMISGLSLSATENDLALLYMATIQALAYSTKHIISEMERHGHNVSLIYLCGGLGKNSLYVQCHSDVTGLPIVLPDAKESVLLGAAILGACASGAYPSLQSTMKAMGGKGRVVEPDTSTTSFHAKKYQVFLEMLKDQRKYERIMNGDD